MEKLSKYRKGDIYRVENGHHYSILGMFLEQEILGLRLNSLTVCESNLKITHDMMKMRDGDRAKMRDYVRSHAQEFVEFFWHVMDEKELSDDDNFLDALEVWAEEQA